MLLGIVTGLQRTLNYEFMAIMLIYRCEQVYTQNENILESIDVLLASTKSRKCIFFSNIT